MRLIHQRIFSRNTKHDTNICLKFGCKYRPGECWAQVGPSATSLALECLSETLKERSEIQDWLFASEHALWVYGLYVHTGIGLKVTLIVCLANMLLVWKGLYCWRLVHAASADGEAILQKPRGIHCFAFLLNSCSLKRMFTLCH